MLHDLYPPSTVKVTPLKQKKVFLDSTIFDNYDEDCVFLRRNAVIAGLGKDSEKIVRKTFRKYLAKWYMQWYHY